MCSVVYFSVFSHTERQTLISFSWRVTSLACINHVLTSGHHRDATTPTHLWGKKKKKKEISADSALAERQFASHFKRRALARGSVMGLFFASYFLGDASRATRRRASVLLLSAKPAFAHQKVFRKSLSIEFCAETSLKTFRTKNPF